MQLSEKINFLGIFSHCTKKAKMKKSILDIFTEFAFPHLCTFFLVFFFILQLWLQTLFGKNKILGSFKKKHFIFHETLNIFMFFIQKHNICTKFFKIKLQNFVKVEILYFFKYCLKAFKKKLTQFPFKMSSLQSFPYFYQI